jgi:hypothetical protein
MENEPKTHYVECACQHLDHLMRVTYDPEYKDFCFEYHLARFPGEQAVTLYGKCSTAKRLTKDILHQLKRFYFYLKNILWAVRGKPVWFTADISLRNEDALKLINFLKENISE